MTSGYQYEARAPAHLWAVRILYKDIRHYDGWLPGLRLTGPGIGFPMDVMYDRDVKSVSIIGGNVKITKSRILLCF